MTAPRSIRLPLGAAALILAAASQARAPSSADECAGIDDPAARLACYDGLHGREKAPATAPPAAPATTPATPARPDPSGAPAAGNGGDIVATVAAVGTQMTGHHWFRLENGQLWSQESAAHTSVEAGDSVRISPGAFGSFFLRRSDGSSRGTRVRRLE